MLAAEQPEICRGLLLLAYPLHPPKEPANLRTAHFRQLRTAALFVQGRRDPFASAEELSAAVAEIPAATTIIIVENAAHDLKKGGFDITRQVIEPFHGLIRTK